MDGAVITIAFELADSYLNLHYNFILFYYVLIILPVVYFWCPILSNEMCMDGSLNTIDYKPY